MKLFNKLIVLCIILISILTACEKNNATISPTIAPITPMPNVASTAPVLSINTDGFNCAISMAINLLDGNFSKTSCQDINNFLSNANDFAPGKYQDPDWLTSNVNAYLLKNSFNYKIEYREKLTSDILNTELNPGSKVNIVVVQIHNMLHAMVVVGYDPARGGLIFLDSLQTNKKDGMPTEKDFEKNYGEKFQEVWKSTYSIEKPK